MFRNYLTIAVRHLRRQPGYSLLNILGFTIGLTSSFLIVMYLFNELSYDKFNEKADRVYRISSDFKEADNAFRWASSQFPLGKTAKEEIGEVEQYTRMIQNGRTTFEFENIKYFERDVFFVDSTMFDVFTYEFVQGNQETALQEPNSLVISETIAQKIFKGENPIGQMVKTDEMTLQVTGVYKDLPFTSHIRPSGLISLSSTDRYNRSGWGSFYLYTYVLIREGVQPEMVVTKLNDEIGKKYVATIFDQFNVQIKYEMINIQDIHLKSTFDGESTALGNMKYIYIFAVVGLFLVLIAAINYMNLATAKSIKRSLEVGLRKVMGAKRSSLTMQFTTESIVLTLISFVISLVLLLIIVPIINSQLNIHMELSNLMQPHILGTILVIIVLTGILSGSYPAFFLSSFAPIVALKGKGSKGSNQLLRRLLVGLQFAVSIFMLVGTVVIYDQMQYLRNKDLGFDKENVMKLGLDSRVSRAKWPVFKARLNSNPFVVSSSTSTSTPGDGFNKNLIKVEQNSGVLEEFGVDMYQVDYDYFTLLNIPFVQGRNISRDFPADTLEAVIVNEAMVKRLNWEEPLGKRFQFNGDSSKYYRVVGVVQDFHQQSLYNPIEGLLFIPSLNNGDVMVKLQGDLQEAIKRVEEDWNEVYAGMPFEYSFLDERFMEQYEDDQLRGKLFLGFSVMMIIIACLGLLGLASFIAEQRNKEISIRKVLGASVTGLVSLLVRDFLILVVFGAIPAFAVGYYFLNEWLANFEYHVNINFLLFFLVLVFISLITVLTTGYHALKAATSNPSDNLRYE